MVDQTSLSAFHSIMKRAKQREQTEFGGRLDSALGGECRWGRFANEKVTEIPRSI